MDEAMLNYFLNDPRGQVILFLLAAWSMAWKGIALWKAVKNSQRNWFIAMLIINSIGILEIIYIFYFSRPKPKNA